MDTGACVLAAIPGADAEEGLGAALTRSTAEAVMASFMAPALLLKAKSKSKKHMAMRMRLFCFSRQYVSCNTFEGKHFRRMLAAGDVNYSKMNHKSLNNWVVKQFHIFLLMHGHATDMAEDFRGGNPFKESLHDGVTLANSKKYQSITDQFIWDYKNWHICIGFKRCIDGTAPGVKKRIEECIARTETAARHASPHRQSAIKLYNKMISDYAALGVAKLMQLLEDGCGVHNDDKIWRDAIGDLIRTRMRAAIDLFPEGIALTKKARDAAK